MKRLVKLRKKQCHWVCVCVWFEVSSGAGKCGIIGPRISSEPNNPTRTKTKDLQIYATHVIDSFLLHGVHGYLFFCFSFIQSFSQSFFPTFWGSVPWQRSDDFPSLSAHMFSFEEVSELVVFCGRFGRSDRWGTHHDGMCRIRAPTVVAGRVDFFMRWCVIYLLPKKLPPSLPRASCALPRFMWWESNEPSKVTKREKKRFYTYTLIHL